jgi:hypothetical protein
MADAATVVMKTTILPDEIAKDITATTTVSPKDANDKWYYKLTSVTAASTDLMAGSYIDYTAVAANTSPDAVSTADKVEFLYIKNVDAANDIYVVFDAGTASNTAGDAIKISPNESWSGRLPNATVADIHAIGYDPVGAAAATASAIVAALLDDVA